MPDCLDGPDGCDGPVEHRQPLSATGRSFPRCDAHWAQRLVEQERIDAAYPDSPIAPDWYDPEAAGERWDDEP